MHSKLRLDLDGRGDGDLGQVDIPPWFRHFEGPAGRDVKDWARAAAGAQVVGQVAPRYSVEWITHGFARLEKTLVHLFNLLQHILDLAHIELGVLLIDEHHGSVAWHAMNRV